MEDGSPINIKEATGFQNQNSLNGCFSLPTGGSGHGESQMLSEDEL